ncbi:lamin tail domain-containing protein [Candidatus Bipolaricaulota bacterium]|nr:lamin tail domain-containing protein [Candidatus Bipolaricaulota bacterium]
MTRHQTTSALAVAIVLLLPCAGWGQVTETDPALHLLINEIEINPPGLDTDREWVELLNPTDEPIDLLGWQISYSYRGDGFLPISETSQVIPPGGRYVFVYPGLRLRNAEAKVFQLIDPDGNVVEETAPFKDEANDDATWQRFPDGGDPLWPDLWLFQADSRNDSNS